MFEWSENWQMQFNVSKCIVVGMGFSNNREIYDLEEMSWKD